MENKTPDAVVDALIEAVTSRYDLVARHYHLKRQIMGREVVVAVTEGRLDFGTWERIFYGEFDGRRRKRVLVKIVGE